LQLVQEAVEPLGQLAYLVVPAQIDALGEIPLAAGDVLEACHHGADGRHDALGHQPDAEQGDRRNPATYRELGGHAALGLILKLPLQLQGRGEHHGAGQLDIDAPFRSVPRMLTGTKVCNSAPSGLQRLPPVPGQPPLQILRQP
jgi:hypothetical protein